MIAEVRSHGFTALGPLHEALARLSGWPAIGAGMALGALAAFAFAPFHFSAVLVIALVGLVWMLDGARAHQRWGRAFFLRGWAFGTGYFLISMHWAAAPFLVDPARTLAFIWMPLILLPAGMALIWGSFISMAGAFWSASPSRVFAFALFFAIAEWIRGTLFGGFPWNAAGTTWVPGGAISQAASLGGIYWLTLLTIFVMSAPAALVDTRDARGLALRLTPSFAAAILLALLWAWGAERISAPSPRGERNIAIMDAGVPQHEMNKLGPDPILRIYLELLSFPESRAGDVVVWPEGAIPAYLLQDINAMDAIGAYLGQRTLITGTPRYETQPQRTIYFNSLAMLDENVSRDSAIALYDKHRLVPFGELAAVNFIPFGQSLSRLLPPALQEMADDGFQPGMGPRTIEAGDLPPFVALICYEGLFPEITRHVTRQFGAEWIVLISNDAWFGSGMGPAQHYAQNRYRAIESGLPLVRAANRGVSGVVDGYGREIMRTIPAEIAPEGWSTSFGRTRLPEPAARTFYYTRAGGALFWLTLVLFAPLAFLTWRR